MLFRSAHGLSLVVASGGYSSLWCVGFSLRWFLLLQSTSSRRVGFSSCGSWAQWLWLTASGVVAQGLSCSAACGIFPDQGSNCAPVMAGGFLTTAPPGKSWDNFILTQNFTLVKSHKQSRLPQKRELGYF